MTVWVGTSGWQYAHWRRRFYPRGLAGGRWLAHYAAHFATVEINASFYRLPSEDQFARWASAVPPDFVFAVKANRYLTHVRRLLDPGPAWDRFLRSAGRLGPHLGPILVQLPPNLPADPDRLARFLQLVPPGVRVALEFRHDSWFSAPVRSLLERHGAALCLVDLAGPRGPRWLTTDWAYLRFHVGRGEPSPCYEDAELAAWTDVAAELVATGARELFAYFNNDPLGCAVRDAARLAAAIRHAGLPVARTPPPDLVTVGTIPSADFTPPSGG
jgi:uncharacterized protein YecE (DUF72 family)